MQNYREDDNVLLLLTATTTLIASITAIKCKKRKKRLWTMDWLQKRERGREVLNMINKELLHEDPIAYHNYLRMTNVVFEKLLIAVENAIKKQDTKFRSAISPRNRLEVTLRFLATGESFRSLMYSTRIDETTISQIVPDVMAAIVQNIKEIYLRTPTTEIEWLKIAEDFENIWQFPHCLGALDGRHIKFRPPRSDGSYYYNYKGEHSIVLLALVDASYKFTYCNIGVNGRVSDGGVFRESQLKQALQSNKLNFPPPTALPGRTTSIPYVIVADDAFPLLKNIMKPYPERNLSYDKRIFNYRLSRARRIVENAFGILANRFRVLLTPIGLRPSKVELITLCCVVLHNFLAAENTIHYPNEEFLEEQQVQKNDLVHLGRQGGNRWGDDAMVIRDELKNYFNTNGAVTWQNGAVENYNY